MEFTANSLQQTEDIAKRLCPHLKSGDAILFRGEMGAGKTTITRTIAEYFHCAEDVSSPTFSLVNTYVGDKKLYHFDLYRLRDIEDLYAIGFFDYIQDDAIFIIEWSENIPELADEFERVIEIEITKLGENERKFSISGVAL